MKKIVLSLLLVVAFLNVSSQEKSNSQEKVAFEKDTYRLVSQLSLPLFKSLTSSFIGMVKPEKMPDFKKELEASYPSLFKSMSKIYMEEFTHKDIKGTSKNSFSHPTE